MAITRYRVSKDNPAWAIFPDEPWSVFELTDDDEWWKRGNYATWDEAIARVRELSMWLEDFRRG